MKHAKKLKLALGVALALGAASSAMAGISWYHPITTFEDNNLDAVIDNNTNGVLDVGDQLVSVIEWETTSGINAGQGPSANLPVEVSGVADVTITSILGDGTLVLAPTNQGGGEGLLGSFAAGTAVAIYVDNNPDLNVIAAACGTQTQCEALAGLGLTDGSSLYMTAGFFGDADAQWTSSPAAGGTSIATVTNGPASTKFGTFNFSLDLGINNTGQIFAEQACVFCGPGGDGMIDIVGSGDVLGGQGGPATNGWTARSDSDFQMVPIPEPGGLALLGMGLLGLVGGLRKRFS